MTSTLLFLRRPSVIELVLFGMYSLLLFASVPLASVGPIKSTLSEGINTFHKKTSFFLYILFKFTEVDTNLNGMVNFSE